MPYKKWHQQAVKKAPRHSDLKFYFFSLIFGLIWFGATYLYTNSMEIPHALNKAVADTAIILIGFSMLLTAICYFWDFLDSKIIYRKYLGLVGFAFALLHIALSWDTFLNFFNWELWQSGAVKAVAAGMFATIIFVVMALISNKFAARELGGIWWRRILRTGYLAVVLVFLHVVWLKSTYWVRWWQGGLERPPSSSLLVSAFMLLVVVSRIALEISLWRRRSQIKTRTRSK